MIVTRRRLFSAASTLVVATLLCPTPLEAATIEDGDLVLTLQEIERRISARLGVFIIDTQTGREWAYNADKPFPLCGILQFVAVGALLWRIDKGYDDLERRIPIDASAIVPGSPVTEARVGTDMSLEEVCAAALTQNDNSASNMVIDALRGPSGVWQFARSIGDPAMRLDHWAPESCEAKPEDPRDTTLPSAMALTMRSLALGDVLSKRSRNQLKEWLIDGSKRDLTFTNSFPTTWKIGEKSGNGGYGTTSKVALIWPPNRQPIVTSIFMTQTESDLHDRKSASVAIGRLLQSII